MTPVIQAVVYSFGTGCLFWLAVYTVYRLQKLLAIWIGTRFLGERNHDRAFCEGSHLIGRLLLKGFMAITMALVTFIVGANILLAIFGK